MLPEVTLKYIVGFEEVEKVAKCSYADLFMWLGPISG